MLPLQRKKNNSNIIEYGRLSRGLFQSVGGEDALNGRSHCRFFGDLANENILEY